MKVQLALSTALFLVACAGENDAKPTTVNGASGSNSGSSDDSTYATVRRNNANTGSNADGASNGNASGNAGSGTGATTARTTGANTSDTTGTTNGGPAAHGNGGGSTTAGGISPNTTSSSAKASDNTGVNERDRGGGATPVTQGNSQSEINISASIRRAVVGNKARGFNAKNVKIITVGSKVTLRGPVGSEQERGIIETQAKQTAGVTEVDNQIEVKK